MKLFIFYLSVILVLHPSIDTKYDFLSKRAEDSYLLDGKYPFKTNTHPIHLAISDIEHNQKEKSLEIIHKVFIDDFEKILELNYKQRLHLATNKEHPDTDKLIVDYLNKNFVVLIDGKPQKVEFHGKFNNAKEDIFAIWILSKIENISQLKTIKIQNTILKDLYEDQDNFVHIKYLGQKKSMRFKGEETEYELIF